MKSITRIAVTATLIVLAVINGNLFAQSVGIGTSSPNSSALVDISSNTKGMLMPRMTQTERDAIATPAQGLTLFNTTTNSFQYYNGVSWINITSSGIVTGTNNRVAKFAGIWGLQNSLLTDNGTGLSLNTSGNNADASAMLDITSTTKGVLIPRLTTAQRTAIASPAKGLMVYDSTNNSYWYHNGTAWTQVNNSNDHWALNGTSLYNPNGGNVGIGTNSPFYKLQVNNGSFALYNSTDNIFWTMNYSSSVNLFYFSDGVHIPLAFDNSGRVSVGNYPPGATLDVFGNAKVSSDLTVGGDVFVEGNKGILHNTAGAAQLKYYTRTAAFTAILGGNALSAEGSINFTPGIFTSPPQVMVGDIVSTGGTVGELYRVQLVIYDVTTTSCHARLLNTSPNPVNYNITWNIICIGN